MRPQSDDFLGSPRSRVFRIHNHVPAASPKGLICAGLSQIGFDLPRDSPRPNQTHTSDRNGHKKAQRRKMSGISPEVRRRDACNRNARRLHSASFVLFVRLCGDPFRLLDYTEIPCPPSATRLSRIASIPRRHRQGGVPEGLRVLHATAKAFGFTVSDHDFACALL
jgi:hypothetical protein